VAKCKCRATHVEAVSEAHQDAGSIPATSTNPVAAAPAFQGVAAFLRMQGGGMYGSSSPASAIMDNGTVVHKQKACVHINLVHQLVLLLCLRMWYNNKS
jgi:hypothetical protein